MIRLIDFDAAHADDLFKRSTTLATADSKYVLGNWLDRLQRKDRSFSLVDNGHLVAASGVVEIWPGMAEAWLIPSDDIVKYKFKVVRLVRQMQDEIMAEDELHRLQATVRADYSIAVKFIEFVGFKLEGVMKNYGPDGTDHLMYARVA